MTSEEDCGKVLNRQLSHVIHGTEAPIAGENKLEGAATVDSRLKKYTCIENHSGHK